MVNGTIEPNIEVISMLRYVIPLMVLAAFVPGAARADWTQTPEFKSCLAKIEAKADDGFEAAIAWGSLGGGDAAKHCVVRALAKLGHRADAASRLEDLANDTVVADAFRAKLYDEAAVLWLAEGADQRAEENQMLALKLNSQDPDIRLHRALLLIELNRLPEAMIFLEPLVAQDPTWAWGHALVGLVYSQDQQDGLALRSLDQAVLLDPMNPDIRLIRAESRVFANDRDGARADFIRVLQSVSPESALGQRAQRGLEGLDGPVRN